MGFSGEKKKQYQVEWLSKRKAKGHELLGNRCNSCRSQNNLEIDHIDPKTKDPSLIGKSTRGFSWSRSWKFIEVELKKCQLLCDSCHNKKTGKDLSSDLHGITKYDRHGCRCNICKAAKKIYNAKRYN